MRKLKLGILFLALGLIAIEDLKAEGCCQEESVSQGSLETENGTRVRFRRPPDYENSVVRDPIERRPVVSYPNSYESSFYEEMTR